MSATRPVSSTSPGEWRQGWGVVLAAAMGISIGGLHMHFIGTMIPSLQEAYDWSRGEIAFGLTLIMVINLVGNLVVGALADRYGMRPVALWGALLFGIGFSALGLAGPAISTWYAACAFFAVLHLGVTPVVWTGGVVKWFEARRGMALALSLTGGGVMVAVTPLMVIWLVGAVGVRWIFPTVGIIGALLILMPAWRFFHDRKGHVRKELDSKEQQSESSALAPAAEVGAAPVSLPGFSAKEAFRQRRFWQLLLAFLLVALAAGTFLVHVQPMLVDSGLTPARAATVALFIGPSMIIGRLLMGTLFDYFDPRLVTALAFTLPLAAALMLANLDGSYGLAVCAGILVGLCLGAEVDVLAYLTSRYFGLKAYGVLFAIMMSAHGAGIGIGSALAGFGFDNFGNYDQWLLALAAGAVVAIGLVLSVGLPSARKDILSLHPH